MSVLEGFKLANGEQGKQPDEKKYLNVEIIRLNKDLPIPQYATSGSAAVDLYANIEEPVELNRYQSQLIPTGIKVNMPEGFFGMMVPRSSTGSKGFSLANTVGIIDSDYQNEIFMNIKNTSTETIVIEPKTRLAQLLFIKAEQAFFKEVETFSTGTERTGGFGSTGTGVLEEREVLSADLSEGDDPSGVAEQFQQAYKEAIQELEVASTYLERTGLEKE